MRNLRMNTSDLGDSGQLTKEIRILEVTRRINKHDKNTGINLLLRLTKYSQKQRCQSV